MPQQDEEKQAVSPAEVTPDANELEHYAAHAPVLEQATAFLTHIATTVTLYATVTGAAWAVVASNALGVDPTTLRGLLGLHIFLSILVAISVWGVGNNFIQRLNFARWLGVAFWPNIEKLGHDYAWKGVPKPGADKPFTANSIDKRPIILKKINLRHQRIWAVLPIGAAVFSGWLLLQIWIDGPNQAYLCGQAAATLSFSAPPTVTREMLDRARYVFDKAGCEIRYLYPTSPPESLANPKLPANSGKKARFDR